MKSSVIIMFIMLSFLISSAIPANSANGAKSDLHYALRKLPLGSIQPTGWLNDQLQIMARGLTGHLDEFWPDIQNSAWKGGAGEAWERGPYYLDGLVPLAYILNDQRLIAKIQPFIETMLASRRPNGWFGPAELQDRWPLAVACKVLCSVYEATQDERVLALLHDYFAFLHESPPDWPDNAWRGVRAMENSVSGLWLYHQTGNPQILETIASIQQNSYNWTGYYEQFPWDAAAVAEKRVPLNWGTDGLTAHIVNNAMAIKYPGLWYAVSGEARYKQAVYAALEKYERHHGQIGGRFSGDEHLSGRDPAQGTELCAVVETMFSLEKLIEILADVRFADQLEYLAYNSLPGTMTPDGWAHQYDQQANQVLVSVSKRNWSSNGDHSNIYGLMPNFPCCLANMHQGWPKFVEHLCFASPDSGLAFMAYAPCIVKTRVAGDAEVRITAETLYPFDESITFTIECGAPAEFPLYFRIPSWSPNAQLMINGNATTACVAGTMHAVSRQWQNGDIVQLTLPMTVHLESRSDSTVAVKRGPLYYALRIGKQFSKLSFQEKSFSSIPYMGSVDWQIEPTTAWNYGLLVGPQQADAQIKVQKFPLHEFPFADRGDQVYWPEWDTHVSWEHEPPIVLQASAKQIPSWGMKDNSAAPPSRFPFAVSDKSEEVYLIPYGCSRLRIAEFPLIPCQAIK